MYGRTSTCPSRTIIRNDTTTASGSPTVALGLHLCCPPPTLPTLHVPLTPPCPLSACVHPPSPYLRSQLPLDARSRTCHAVSKDDMASMCRRTQRDARGTLAPANTSSKCVACRGSGVDTGNTSATPSETQPQSSLRQSSVLTHESWDTNINSRNCDPWSPPGLGGERGKGSWQVVKHATNI